MPGSVLELEGHYCSCSPGTLGVIRESATTLQVLYRGAKCKRGQKVRLISLGEQSVNIKENFLQEVTFELGHKE